MECRSRRCRRGGGGEQQLGGQLLKGDVFLFVGRCRRRAKVLYFDGTGLVLLTKRLFKGRFASPWVQAGAASVVLTVGSGGPRQRPSSAPLLLPTPSTHLPSFLLYARAMGNGWPERNGAPGPSGLSTGGGARAGSAQMSIERMRRKTGGPWAWGVSQRASDR
ncbi:IS66 family insertion sequence element accessory protein TnpB [Archangium violaceum]|uniref:IS66 family insertion sequence element accessory protein TnpB n=1 Tax=Archangium violaceum TaxID=83451 RepID=UPI00193BD24F|nr:IS66 family insertion sequence element accessory protein TnpB [Archangium violaceum]